MLKIYVARHGQNIDNVAGILNGHRDEPLTEKGIAQARMVSEKIKAAGISFDAVYSSPLVRAYDTAKIICESVETLKIEKEPLLIERDFGIMTGKNISDIETVCAPDIIKTDTITYFLSPEGAETFPELMRRARLLLRKVEETHADGSVLLVTHGDIGKMLYAEYYQLEWKQVLTQFHFGNCDLLLMAKDSKFDEVHVFKLAQFNH